MVIATGDTMSLVDSTGAATPARLNSDGHLVVDLVQTTEPASTYLVDEVLGNDLCADTGGDAA